MSRRHPASNRLQERVEALVSLVRVPVRSSHVPYLDGWRGICILLVLIGHGIRGLEPLGNVGVEFFFALSGCLMAEILIFKRQDVALFLRRRIARIFPAVAVYVAIVGVAINVSVWLDGDPLRLTSPLAALFYFHHYLPSRSVVPMFEHTWSLAVEEHSYLLLVGIVLLARHRPLTAAAIALAISALAVVNAYRLYALPYSGGQFITWRTDVRAGSSIISFALCILLRCWNVRRLPAWVPAGRGGGSDHTPLHRGPHRPVAVHSMHPARGDSRQPPPQFPDRLRSALASPVLLWFGTLSFSLYVWQQILFTFAHHGFAPLPCVAVMFGFAVASYKLVENPARDYLNSRWGGSGGLAADWTPWAVRT